MVFLFLFRSSTLLCGFHRLMVFGFLLAFLRFQSSALMRSLCSEFGNWIGWGVFSWFLIGTTGKAFLGWRGVSIRFLHGIGS